MQTRIRLCENCGGKIGPAFYVVKLAQVLVDYGAVSRHAGMAIYFQGNQALADLFSPDSALEKVIEGDDANKWPEVTICQKCCLDNPLLTKILEKTGGQDDIQTE